MNCSPFWRLVIISTILILISKLHQKVLKKHTESAFEILHDTYLPYTLPDDAIYAHGCAINVHSAAERTFSKKIQNFRKTLKNIICKQTLILICIERCIMITFWPLNMLKTPKAPINRLLKKKNQNFRKIKKTDSTSKH